MECVASPINDGCIGFRHPHAGLYLGHNKWELYCKVPHFAAYEKFRLHQSQSRDGYVMLVRDWAMFGECTERPVIIKENTGKGVRTLTGEKFAHGPEAVWEFERVQ